MAMRVFCALTSHKIYDHLTSHLRLDTTLGAKSREKPPRMDPGVG